MISTSTSCGMPARPQHLIRGWLETSVPSAIFYDDAEFPDGHSGALKKFFHIEAPADRLQDVLDIVCAGIANEDWLKAYDREYYLSIDLV